MSNNDENLIPSEYWNPASKNEMEALREAAAEMDTYLSEQKYEWVEMDDTYYTHLRYHFKKGSDEIGSRQFKHFQNTTLPIQMIVIPAGREHNGSEWISYYHTLTEDMEYGQCNGTYELVTELELENKFNIKYNN